MEAALSLSLVAAVGLAGLAYLLRVAARGRTRHARVEAEGESALLTKGSMEMVYWGFEPIAAAFARARVSANAITWASLALGVAAGVAIAFDHFGMGAWLAVLSASGDALDGLVARRTRTASDAGEVLDAAVDRYVELALLGGLAVHLRHELPGLALALGAMAGSFMVSYSTAKAEALQIKAPRGSMRRAERAVLIVAGVALTPLTSLLGVGEPWRDAPILVALGLIAVLGNASAIARFAHIAAVARGGRP